LILQRGGPVDRILPTACRLCNDWETHLLNSHQDAKRAILNEGKKVEPYGTLAQFRRYLGRYMEQLALFALPKDEVEAAEDQSESQSDDNESARSEIEDYDDDDELVATVRRRVELANERLRQSEGEGVIQDADTDSVMDDNFKGQSQENEPATQLRTQSNPILGDSSVTMSSSQSSEPIKLVVGIRQPQPKPAWRSQLPRRRRLQNSIGAMSSSSYFPRDTATDSDDRSERESNRLFDREPLGGATASDNSTDTTLNPLNRDGESMQNLMEEPQEFCEWRF
jgi:hypothetical protein